MFKKLTSFCLLTLLTTAAWAQSPVTIDITAQKEVVTLESGKEVRLLVPAKETQTGEIIFFTVQYTNKGTKPIRNVAVDDPIPAGLSYLPGTVWGEGADISFSIDHGKNFKKPSLLTYEVADSQGTAVKKVASPEEYTDIRWIISEVPAGGAGQVGFKARVR